MKYYQKKLYKRINIPVHVILHISLSTKLRHSALLGSFYSPAYVWTRKSIAVYKLALTRTHDGGVCEVLDVNWRVGYRDCVEKAPPPSYIVPTPTATRRQPTTIPVDPSRRPPSCPLWPYVYMLSPSSRKVCLASALSGTVLLAKTDIMQ